MLSRKRGHFCIFFRRRSANHLKNLCYLSLFFFVVSVFFVCLHEILCTVYMQEPIEARRGHQTPGTRVTDGSELLGMGAGK